MTPFRAALAALLLSAAPAWAQELGIHDPYAIASVPGAPTGAAFMLIRNDGSEPDRLLSAASPVAERVEIHTHVEENGVMRMERVEDGLEVPAGGVLLLGRGRGHVMFLGITDSFEDGDVIPLTLTFEEAGQIAVEVPVDLDRLAEEAPEGHAEDPAAMDHGDMGAEAHEGHGG